jgi:hypothetical protein
MQPDPKRTGHVPEVAAAGDHVREHVELAVDRRPAGLLAQAIGFVGLDVARRDAREHRVAVAKSRRGLEMPLVLVPRNSSRHLHITALFRTVSKNRDAERNDEARARRRTDTADV